MMPGHELVAADTVQQHMHDGPLRSDGLPAPLGFFAWKRDRPGSAQVRLQRAAVHEHAAPDHFAGLADSLQASTAKAKIHGRLPLTDGAAIAIRKVSRRSGA